MRKFDDGGTKRWRAITVGLAVVLAAGTALAASVKLKGGPNAEPDFMDGGLTLTADGELSGLGNGDVLITLEATADSVSTCTNQGGNAAPGQNPGDIMVIGAVAIPEEEQKNGNTPFNVMTEAPISPVPGAPGCENPNWTETIDDLMFTSATITVEQPVGTVVLVVQCTFSPATSDGVVPSGTVSCIQT